MPRTGGKTTPALAWPLICPGEPCSPSIHKNMTSPISHYEVSFLSPYPQTEGERRVQAFSTREEAERMADFYNSMGSYDAKVKPIGKEYQYPG